MTTVAVLRHHCITDFVLLVFEADTLSGVTTFEREMNGLFAFDLTYWDMAEDVLFDVFTWQLLIDFLHTFLRKFWNITCALVPVLALTVLEVNDFLANHYQFILVTLPLPVVPTSGKLKVNDDVTALVCVERLA